MYITFFVEWEQNREKETKLRIMNVNEVLLLSSDTYCPFGNTDKRRISEMTVISTSKNETMTLEALYSSPTTKI